MKMFFSGLLLVLLVGMFEANSQLIHNFRSNEFILKGNLKVSFNQTVSGELHVGKDSVFEGECRMGHLVVNDSITAGAINVGDGNFVVSDSSVHVELPTTFIGPVDLSQSDVQVSIGTSELEDGSVTTNKLEDETVTSAKIKHNSLYSLVLPTGPSQTISAGDAVTIVNSTAFRGVQGIAGATSEISRPYWTTVSITEHAAALGSSRVVIGFRDADTTNWGNTIIGAIEHEPFNITYGTPSMFNTGSSNYVLVIGLDDTHFVAAIKDESAGSNGHAVVGVVSGETDLSFGTEVIFNSGNTRNMGGCRLDSTSFAIAYRDSGNADYGTLIVGYVSGDSFSSWTAEIVYCSFYSVPARECVSSLDSTHLVVAYPDGANNDYGTVKLAEVNGGVITLGDAYVFNAGAGTYSVIGLDSTHFVVTYVDSSFGGMSAVGTIDGGGNFAFGSFVSFNGVGFTAGVSSSKLSSSKFIVAFQDTGNSGYGTYVIGTVSGTSISFSSKVVFSTDTTTAIVAMGLHSTGFAIKHRTSTKYEVFVHEQESTPYGYLSVAVSNANEGEDVYLKLCDTVDGFSDLIPGKKYYAGDDGSISISQDVAHKSLLGFAISDKDLLVTCPEPDE